jgi:hypothetical protein
VAEHGYEYDDYDNATTTGTTKPARPRLDAVSLVFGMLVLLVSAYVLSDGASWMPSFDLRWVLSGGAVLIGVLMLVASTHDRRNRHR